MGDHGTVYDRRTARLRERADFLRVRVKKQRGDGAARSLAEITALDWALVTLEDLWQLLGRVEWGCLTPNGAGCPSCGEERRSGHTDDCRLAVALARLRGGPPAGPQAPDPETV